MKENIYVKNIKALIENNIVETTKRNLQIENNKITTYWNVGREIVQAEKEDKIKYGNSFIKELSAELTKQYGKGYDYTNLTRMKQLFLTFQNIGSLSQYFITWTHFRYILPIKNENERNYYINLVNDNCLSVRQLKEEIKNNAYERLDEKVKKSIKLSPRNPSTIDLIKGPLLLNLNGVLLENLNEKALKKVILEQIEKFLLELGAGFAFVSSEKKIKIGNTYKYIDLLFFNIEENCYVVIELKINRLTARDLGQLELYVNYIDIEYRKEYHNKTIGIIICSKIDKHLIKFLPKENIKVTTFKLKKSQNALKILK